MKRVLTILLLGAISTAAIADVIDPLDKLDNFFQKSDGAILATSAGAVELSKLSPDADAFVRYGNPTYSSIPIRDDTRKVTINVKSLSPGTTFDVLVQLEGKGDTDLGHFPAKAGINQTGDVVIVNDLKVFAQESKQPEAIAVRLLIRHTGDPTGKVVLDEIKFGPTSP
jgi:hypothetical protein